MEPHHVPSGETTELAALKARIALGVKMLTNAGYAMLGGAVFKPLIAREAVGPLAGLWAGAAVIALAFALFLTPDGEASDA